jgi:hypothetical protein
MAMDSALRTRIRQERVRMLGGRTLALGQAGEGSVRLTSIRSTSVPKAADRLTLAAGGHLGDHRRGQLQVPGIVEFAGFQHGTARAFGIAAALEGHGGKAGLAGSR